MSDHPTEGMEPPRRHAESIAEEDDGHPEDREKAAPRRVPLSGILLVFLGLLFLADTLSLFRTESVIAAWWPAILVVIGLEQLINARASRSSGLLLALIGSAMLAFTVGPLEWETFVRWWPAILVVVGLGVILKPRGSG